MNTILSIGADALAYGMVLFVICIGLSLTMGLMKIVNLTHGAFAMIGGYIASYAIQGFGLGYPVAVAAAIVGTILLAVPLERVLFRRIYGAPELTQVLMTIGITFVIIGLANLLFGPMLKTIPLPSWLQGGVDIGFRSIAAHRLFAIAAGGIVAALLWLVLEKTLFGVRLRAAVDDSAMAAALGVRTQQIYALAFALAVGLAALGGVVGAQLLPIEPYYALRYMVLFLVVVAVGGAAGSIGGALLACLTLGAIETTARYLVPEYGEFFFYLAVIVIVGIFPHGIQRRAQ